jgi:hypothetical protein
MKRMALLAAAALLAGCGGGGGSGDQGIVAGLESHDVEATSPQPEPPGVLEVPSTVYAVPGGVLHVFTFDDEEAARNGAARVNPDGYTVQNTSGINQAIDWAAPPHWFRGGKEVAVYVGTSTQVIDVLTEVAGSQFAGT